MSSHFMTWWQRDDLGYQDGQLFFADKNVAALAEKFGTPVFVYSAKRVESNILRLKTALNLAGLKNRFSIYYAMKANRLPSLLTYLKINDLCGIDACSPMEVEHAISCGFVEQDISFTATSLSKADFDRLSGFDISFTCDSLHSIKQWGERNPGTEIGIRINPLAGIGRTGNEKLHYAGEHVTKFGIYQEQFNEALKLASKYQLQVTKIHFHTGCGYLNKELEQLKKILNISQQFINQLNTVKKINVGGGLGVPHFPHDENLDLTQWSTIMAEFVLRLDLHLEIEPGDYIVKDAGLLLLEKTYTELKKNTLYLGVNAGFNLAPEPAHYQLPFQPVPLEYEENKFVLTPMHVVGNVNEALDVWYENALLPNREEQNYLALINAGAYSSSMASNHCMRGQFKEILLV